MLNPMEPVQNICPVCHFAVLETYYFCPNCGKNLKPAPLPTNTVKQIGIYALSILLPPLGLWPGVKYLMQKTSKAKIIGLVAILLTIVSTLVTSYYFIGWANKINQEVTKQLNQYQNIGY
jgi:hypothetical protein